MMLHIDISMCQYFTINLTYTHIALYIFVLLSKPGSQPLAVLNALTFKLWTQKIRQHLRNAAWTSARQIEQCIFTLTRPNETN